MEKVDVASVKALAHQVHDEQLDKAGEPYFGHLERVAADIPDEDGKIVAWLHDAIEDGGGAISIPTLAKFGLSVRQLHALDAISRRRGEPYDEYLRRVRQDPIALKVKKADLADNMSEERLGRLDPEESNRLRRKYTRAVAFLASTEAGVNGECLRMR